MIRTRDTKTTNKVGGKNWGKADQVFNKESVENRGCHIGETPKVTFRRGRNIRICINHSANHHEQQGQHLTEAKSRAEKDGIANSNGDHSQQPKHHNRFDVSMTQTLHVEEHR